MRGNTFFALAFVVLFALTVLGYMGVQEAIDDCKAKGGVLVQTYSGGDLCVKKEAVIK